MKRPEVDLRYSVIHRLTKRRNRLIQAELKKLDYFLQEIHGEESNEFTRREPGVNRDVANP